MTEGKDKAAQPVAGEPVAWSPDLTYPGYAQTRVWANGAPEQRDIDYWSKQGLGITLAYTAATAPTVPLAPSQEQFVGLLERIKDLEGVLRMVDDNRRADDGEEGVKAWRGDFVDAEVRRVLGGIKAGK